MSNSPESEDSSTHIKLTYLSDYFAARGFKKPPITWYTIENGSLNDLRQIVANRLFAGSAIRMDYILAYLCGVADTQLKHRLKEDWISYTIKIGEKGEKISLRNLFEIEEEVKVRINEETTEDTYTKSDDVWIVCTIFTIWRLNRFFHKRNQFTKTIQNAGKFIPFRDSNHPNWRILSRACKSWGNHPELSRIVAGYDMFLFPLGSNNQFDFVRFGSCISRNRDIEILLSINAILNTLGLKYYHQLHDWMFVNSLDKEMERILNSDDEINSSSSYLPYLKDLCQIPISPYCRASNPRLYSFINTIGALCISTGCMKAQMYKNYDLNDILLNAFCVSYAINNISSLRLMVMDEKVYESLTKDEQENLFSTSFNKLSPDYASSDDPPNCHDGEKYFNWLKHKQFVIPQVIRAWVSCRAKYLNVKECQKGSFGFFLKTFDFGESFSWKLESPIE